MNDYTTAMIGQRFRCILTVVAMAVVSVPIWLPGSLEFPVKRAMPVGTQADVSQTAMCEHCGETPVAMTQCPTGVCSGTAISPVIAFQFLVPQFEFSVASDLFPSSLLTRPELRPA